MPFSGLQRSWIHQFFYDIINIEKTMKITYKNDEEYPKYKAYNINNLSEMPFYSKITDNDLFNINVVGTVLPFKTNSYVVNELIDWEKYKTDPLYILTFPQKNMLKKKHFDSISKMIRNNSDKTVLQNEVKRIRNELNPNPAGQSDYNIPEIEGRKIFGLQHKYKETLLVFPRQGQTCHAYCTFCFRWPQFTNETEYKHSLKDIDEMIYYLKEHKEITSVLITGGDPMVMSCEILSSYIEPILELRLPNLISIRIGTKSLSYWPYRFFGEKDSEDILNLFHRIKKAKKHLAIMAHFNHTNELKTKAVRKAIHLIRETGAQIRTQAPLLRNINDNPIIWEEMWKEQVKRGLIPYYMFLPRETGAQQYFSVPLVKAWEIFREAYRNVSGLAKTVRGPIMSCTPGKVQILGVSNVKKRKIFSLKMIQGRNSNWVDIPFFAKYNANAIWFDELKPAFREKKFYFEK
jgi:KamA family protein